jgi:hypothetical protein
VKQSKLYKQVSTKGLMTAADVQAHVPAMRSLWSVHVRGCLRREIENRITIDDYARTSRERCLYCGSPPTNRTKWPGTVILYNGVDRIDNAKPYTVDNIAACCKLCNAMKSGLPTKKFLEHVHRIASYAGDVHQKLLVVRALRQLQATEGGDDATHAPARATTA